MRNIPDQPKKMIHQNQWTSFVALLFGFGWRDGINGFLPLSLLFSPAKLGLMPVLRRVPRGSDAEAHTEPTVYLLLLAGINP